MELLNSHVQDCDNDQQWPLAKMSEDQRMVPDSRLRLKPCRHTDDVIIVLMSCGVTSYLTPACLEKQNKQKTFCNKNDCLAI